MSTPTPDPAPGSGGRPRRTRRRRAVLAGVALVTLVAAGCGDDDESASGAEGTVAAPAAGGASSRFCGDALAVEVVPQPEIDFESATGPEIAAAVGAWAEESMRPLADAMVASAPDQVAAEAAVLSGAVDQVVAGNPEAFDAPDVVEAARTYDDFVDRECGWAALEVTTVDFAFEGLPSELGAGPTRLSLGNDGAEYHEVLLLRRNPGVELAVEDLFEMSEEEAFALVTPAGPPALAPPGASESVVYDLAAGDYIAVCMIPMGITSQDSVPAPDALPHAAAGMVAELTVR